MIRFRMGVGILECKYWMGEQEKYMVCGYEKEDWEHVLDRCVGGMDEGKGVDERVIWILDESG